MGCSNDIRDASEAGTSSPMGPITFGFNSSADLTFRFDCCPDFYC